MMSNFWSSVFWTIVGTFFTSRRHTTTVKLGDKESFDKEQIGVN